MAFLRPSFIDNMSWEMAEVYGAITDQILINLARHFPYWKPGQPVPQSAFEYQANMLAEMGQVNEETVRIIRNGLKGANSALSKTLEQSIMEAVAKAQPELLKGVKEGILRPAQIPIVAPNQMRAYQLYYQQAAQKLNLVNTVMLESTKQAYQSTVSDIVSRIQATQTALDVGAGEVVTGVSSWNQALRHSINRMKENGITGFIDHGGHRWSAEAYTAMDIRTTMANTARAAVWETNQDFGNDLYMVSYHNGARPLCYPWQNKVISSTDNARIVKDLDGNDIPVFRQSDTSYGQPAGLFGINCKHYPTPFIPGVSIIRGQPQDPEENAKTYEDSQKQRALERKIREEKRDLLMMKAQGASAEEIKAQRAKIRQTDDDIDSFCAETGRARRQSREGVFTKREFPDADTYDVTTFERTQKEEIDKYFSNGGAQQGYSFGDTGQQALTTSGTVEQETPPVPTPETPVVDNLEEKDGIVIDNDFDIFDLMANGQFDDSMDIPVLDPEDNWTRSDNYGDFGLSNNSYPTELRYTETEQKYIDDIYAVINNEKRGVDYSSDVYDALIPARNDNGLEWKSERLAQARQRETQRLEQANEMIAQRKAEGYHGRSRAESFARWQQLKEDLEGADEFERLDLLNANQVGKSGIRYWQLEKKKAEKALSDLDFAEKIIEREKHARKFLSEHK